MKVYSRTSNNLSLLNGRISIFRKMRGPRWRREWHNHAGVRYANLSISRPDKHVWWAFSVFVYITK